MKSNPLKKHSVANPLIGEHPSLKRVLIVIEQVAPTDAAVLITGETGTGKELAARLIHEMSSRADRSFITVNCAAVPAQLIESELFGHEKGAFTGAVKMHLGRFEAADGGTLFLDEVGELPIDLQPKLLRALQELKFERVGSSETKSVDVRIVAATNRNLPQMIAEKTFREDLYYRLNVIPIHMPPLRQRRADIKALFMHFLQRFSERHRLSPPAMTGRLLQSIKQYPWPGNVRELSNYVERGIITRAWEPLPTTTLRTQTIETDDLIEPQELRLNEVVRAHIINVLSKTRGVIAGEGGAAQLLGVNANTLRSRMRKLGIEKPCFAL